MAVVVSCDGVWSLAIPKSRTFRRRAVPAGAHAAGADSLDDLVAALEDGAGGEPRRGDVGDARAGRAPARRAAEARWRRRKPAAVAGAAAARRSAVAAAHDVLI